MRDLTIKISKLFLLLPILFTLFYFARSQQLPTNDAANYFLTAININQYFHQHGFMHSVLHAFFERGWRPIFFPEFLVPALLLSNGNLFFAYWVVALTCLVASLYYVYAFLRLALQSFSAALATSVICLLPFIQAQIIMFYAEAALFPCLIGSIYHLIKSDYLRDKQHAIAFSCLAALAIVIRPIEAVTHLLFIALLFITVGFRKRIFSFSQIAFILSLALLAIFSFFVVFTLPTLSGQTLMLMDNGGPLDIRMTQLLRACLIGSSLGAIPAIALLFYIKKYQADALNRPSYLALSFSILLGLVMVWFLPFAKQTFEWIYRTSLGDVASSTGSLSGAHFSWDIFQIYLSEEGILAISIIALLCLLNLIFMTSSNRKKIIFSLPVIYLILMMPFAFWEAFYTVQIVTRKLSVAFPTFLMALLMIALYPGRYLKARNAVVGLLALIQFGLLIALLYTPTYFNRTPALNNTIGYFIPQPATMQPNPHQVMLHFLNDATEQYQLKSIGLELNPGTPDARHFVTSEPFDPFLLSMMITAKNRPYYANYLYFGFYHTDNLSQIGKQYGAIFLSDKTSEMQINANAAKKYQRLYMKETNASLKTFYELLMHYSNNQLLAHGWQLGPCIVIKTQNSGDYNGCLLINKQKLA